MATSAMPFSTSMSVCAICHVDQTLASSYSQGAASMTFTDVDDTLTSSTTFGSVGSLNDATRDLEFMTFGVGQLRPRLVRLYQLVTSLIVQISFIASVVVSLKDRITAVEGTQAPTFGCSQETEALRRQVSKLYKRVASQEECLASLEISRRAEVNSYQKTIQELTAKIESTKPDDKKIGDDTLESLRQSLKLSQQMIECQGARITGVKADNARKIAVLQSELAGVQTELTAVKEVVLPANISSVAEAARMARRERILASVAQRMEDKGMGEEIERLCPLPAAAAGATGSVTVVHDTNIQTKPCAVKTIVVPMNVLSAAEVARQSRKERNLAGFAQRKDAKITEEVETSCPAIVRGSASVTIAHDAPAASASLSNQPVTLPNHGKTEETTARINNKPLTTTRTNIQPGTEKISAISLEHMPAKCGKENQLSNSCTARTIQDTSKPSAGRSPVVNGKPSLASSKEARGSPSVSKPRKSMLPAPRKPLLPSLAIQVVDDEGVSNEVKSADCPPGGSATQMKQLKTDEIPLTAAPSDSASPRTVEKDLYPAGFPASSSLAALDAAVEAMCMNGDSLLTRMPLDHVQAPKSVEKELYPAGFSASSSLTALDTAMEATCMDGDSLLKQTPLDLPEDDDLNSSVVPPIPTEANQRIKNDNVDVLLRQKSVVVKPYRSPLKSTLARTESKITLPELSASLAALEAAVLKMRQCGDILTLIPGPDYPLGAGYDFSTTLVTGAELPQGGEGFHVSPMKKVSTKPCRRL